MSFFRYGAAKRMGELAGYRLHNLLYQGPRSRVYRVSSLGEDKAFVIKGLNYSHPSAEELSRFTYEFETLKLFDEPSVIKAYELLPWGNSLAIVMEDFGGVSLHELLTRNSFTLAEKFSIAIKIVDSLSVVHKQGIIHRDVNPYNLLINPDTQELKLIDFGCAFQVTRERPNIPSSKNLVGTITYLSPEQTGRMNRAIDYRSDYYSLGVTLYELFTGRVPFDSADDMEVVHAHIARCPRPPHLISNDIPELVSNLILKLLAKNAEDRYQSAVGLQHDLAFCEELTGKNQDTRLFVLAEKDIHESFQIPQKLYGRELQIEILVNAFERASISCAEIVLVSGASGIGKSTLINEIYKPISKLNGYFVSGKFGQYRRDVPYDSLIAAFQDLVQIILSESDESIAEWKELITQAVGTSGKLITDVIPEIEMIIGEQPALADLDSGRANVRFNSVFIRFIRVFCRKGRPLALFLDDLQWADSASIKIIRMLLLDDTLKHFLLIGAYRDNEVDSAHPISVIINEASKLDTTIIDIKLEPLQKDNVLQLLNDCLHIAVAETEIEQLSRLIHEKTHGNPFFVKQFILHLYEEGLLAKDNLSNQWHWHIEDISKLEITTNVVDFMVENIQRLPSETRHALQYLACVGAKFDLANMTESAEELSETANHLWPAVEDGLLMPLSEFGSRLTDYKPRSSAVEEKYSFKFRFLHDKVQQAAYALIPEDQRQEFHLKMGRKLLRSLSDRNYSEYIFDIVNQFRQALSLINDPDEKRTVSEIFYAAATKAKNSAAYGEARDNLANAIALLPDDSWEVDREHTMFIYLAQIENEYLVGNYDELQRLSAVALQYCISNIEISRVKIFEIQVHFAKDQYVQAVDQAIDLTKEINQILPRYPTKRHIIRQLIGVKIALRRFDMDAIVNLPMNTDEAEIERINIGTLTGNAAHLCRPKLSIVLILYGIRYCTTHGLSPMSSINFAGYAFILVSVLKKIDKGYEFGQIALKLAEKKELYKGKAKTHFIVNYLVVVWRQPLSQMLTKTPEIIALAIESGDLHTMTRLVSLYGSYAYYAGDPVDLIIVNMESYNATIRQMDSRFLLAFNRVSHQFLLNLRDPNPVPYEIRGEIIDESSLLSGRSSNEDISVLSSLYSLKAELACLYYEYAKGLEFVNESKKYHRVGAATLYSTHLLFIEAICLLSQCAEKARKTSFGEKRTIKKLLKKLNFFADFCPENFLNKIYLIEAEFAACQQKMQLALKKYQQAIVESNKWGLRYQEAQAHELMARYLKREGHKREAVTHLIEALYIYRCQGVKGKVKQLEESSEIKNRLTTLPMYADANNVPKRRTIISEFTSTTRSEVTQQGASFSEHLDMESVLKASTVIASEIVLSSLLTKLVSILLKNAGAERGVLLLDDDSGLMIAAEGNISNGEVQIANELLSDNNDSLAMSIVNYVMRSKKYKVISNASSDESHLGDAYINDKRPKSILCYPLLNRGDLVGLIYLENNLVESAFMTSHLKVLDILSSQMVIALDNSRLYSELEDKNWRIKQILSAAEEMSQSATKHAASLIAIEYLRKLDRFIDLHEAGIYLPQKNADGLVYYPLWKDKHAVTEEISRAVSVEKKARLDNIEEIQLVSSVLVMPLQSESKTLGYLEINRYLDEEITDPVIKHVQVGITRSLALKIDNIEAEEKSRLSGIGAMAASIVHDLKNPINAISGYTELARDKDLNAGTRDDYLEIVQQETERLSSMAQEVLEFSRGEVKLDISQTNSVDFIRDIERTLAPVFANHGFSLLTRIEYQGLIELDTDKIRRIVLNLATNAVDAMASHPIENALFNLNLSQENHNIIMTAADNGPGIPENIKTVLFEPFVTQGKAHGTGLGMAIVKKLIEAHNGKISFTSSKENGTTFTIVLPQRPEVFFTSENNSAQLTKAEDNIIPSTQLVIAETKKTDTEHSVKGKVLLADDDLVNRKLLQAHLKKLGYLSDAACNGKEVIEYLKASQYDILLLDVEMPELDGLQATQIIRESAADGLQVDIPIIAMTGHSGEEACDECIQAGMNGIVSKPINQERLNNILTQHINR